MKSLVTLFLLLTAVCLMTIPATAHHSTTGWFDIGKEITLEGEISRVEWINPHILMYLHARNAKGESEEWILQGFAPNGAIRGGLKRERLLPGTQLTVRAYPARNVSLGTDRVYSISGIDSAKSSHIVEAGAIRFPNGDIQTFGRGPGFGGPTQR